MTFYGINGNCSLRFDDWNKKAALCTAGNNYHCLLNDLGTYGEICVPSTWIQPNLCPVYNTKVQQIDVRLCKYEYGKCPLNAYLSNKVYQYSACFHDDVSAADSTTTSSTTTADSGFHFPTWVLAIIILVLLVIVAVVIFGALLRWRRRRRLNKRKDKDDTDEEEQPMIVLGDDPEIEQHEEDNTFYTRIESVIEGWKKLTQYGVVILIGFMGAGKTKCGLELLSMVDQRSIGDRKYKSHILRNFDDLEHIAASKLNPCILLDDCLERWSYSLVEPTIIDDIICLENVFRKYIQKKSALVVLTLNAHTWERCSSFCKRRNFFNGQHIIQIDRVCTETKIEVLKKHLGSSDTELVKDSKNIMKENDHGHASKIEKDQPRAEPVNDRYRHEQHKQEMKTENEQGKEILESEQGKTNNGNGEGNKTRKVSDTVTGQSPVNEESKDKKDGRKKNTGNNSVEGQDGNDADGNQQTEKAKTSIFRRDKTSIRMDSNNPQQGNTQNAENHNRDTEISSIDETTLSPQVITFEERIPPPTRTDDDIQGDISKVAGEAAAHNIEGKSIQSRSENIKVAKNSGKSEPTQVPKEDNQKERRYKIDDKRMATLAKVQWKEIRLVPSIFQKKPFSLGFPETCALFAMDDKLLDKDEKFFKNPINCLSELFSAWRDSNEKTERQKYVALFYMLMNDGKMDIMNINGDLLSIAKSIYKTGDEVTEDAVKEGMAVLARSYCVKKSPGCFVFQHEVIEYTLLLVAVSKHQNLTFENCDLNVLKRSMITKKNEQPKGELKVPVDSAFFDLLVHRFVMSAVSLENHRCMDDKRFERKYKTHPGTAV